MADLTAKQEAFCKAIALEGKTQKEAFKLAYNWKNMQESTIDEKASRIMHECKISARVKELKDSLTQKTIEKALYTKEESFKELERLKELAIANTGNTGKADISAAIKAEELRGKLAELYTENITIKKKEFSEDIDYL